MMAPKPGFPEPEKALERAPRRRKKTPWNVIVTVLVLAFLATLVIFPLLWMVSTSLKTQPEVYNPNVGLIPRVWNWMNYWRILTNRAIPGFNLGGFVGFPVFQDLKNTLIITIPNVLGTLVSSSVVAYAFSHMQWRGRDKWFIFLLAQMMIPGWVTVIPVYIMFSKLGWVNTFYPLIVPAWFGGAFSVFLLRQFFKRQPASLADAARIDGASEFRIFYQIVLPLAKPALAVVALLGFVGQWTDFFSPLIYLSSPSKYTLMLGLASFAGKHATFWPQLMGANILVILPIVVLFFFAQRQFMEGLHFSGIAG